MASKLKKTMERVSPEFLFDIRTREVDEMIRQRMEERALCGQESFTSASN